MATLNTIIPTGGISYLLWYPTITVLKVIYRLQLLDLIHSLSNWPSPAILNVKRLTFLNFNNCNELIIIIIIK